MASTKLRGEQAKTLLAVRDEVHAWGFIRSARELAQALNISTAAASMRLHRLKHQGYLIQHEEERSWTLDTSKVVDKQTTAKVLIEFRARCESHGRLSKAAFLVMAQEEFNLGQAQATEIMTKMVDMRYFFQSPAWPDDLQVGPRTGNEFEYLQLLAER
ncbi:MAG: hypothetical protein GY725_15545 [bacterium]|nr:hypothetical protein [bacterium]